MNDLVLQWIFLPITIAMYGVEALGKAVSAAQSSGAPDATSAASPTIVAAPPPVSGPTSVPEPGGTHPRNEGDSGVKPVPYHPNATKGCCQG